MKTRPLQARRPFMTAASPFLLLLSTSLPALASPMGDALDAPSLTWTSDMGGDVDWTPQAAVTHDDTDALESGDIGDDENCGFETTVTGPGTLTWWWQVSSEESYDYLSFILDDDTENQISGEVDWQQETISIPAGTHSIKWRYSKDGSGVDGSDAAWVDEVVFTPDGPVNTGGASDIAETSAILSGTVDPQGLTTTAVFEYGPTTAYGNTMNVVLSPNNGNGFQQVSVNLANLQAATLYHYRLVASNSSNPAPGVDKTFTTISPFDYDEDNGQITITGYNGTSDDVVIPTTIAGLPVTAIGDYAFEWRDDLKSITIPAGVTHIGEEAFYFCEGLTSITIPNSVTTINSYAFAGCESLTSVSIPSAITTIGSGVFESCRSLTSVTIPNGVTGIGSRMFAECYGLQSVTIPNSVTSIGSRAFEECENLTSLTIPNSVTSIGAGAFTDCRSLVALAIPSGLTEIQDDTFTGCRSLASFTIPSGVTSIGDNAFSGCELLTALVIPANVASIGSDAFRDCSGLTSMTIPSGVISIAYGTFYGCQNLTSVTIPNTVTSIGSYAFFQCGGLPSLSIPSGVTDIGYSTFSNCHGLTSLVIPAGVTSIDDETFAGCSSLASLVIPSGVNYIGYAAFSGCSRLTNLVIPSGVTAIRDETFYGCRSLISITLPAGLSYIGENAFYDCRRLTGLIIPNSVTSIEDGAFSGCASLTSLTLPAGIDDIGESAFSGCPNMAAITVEPLNADFSSIAGVLYNKTQTALIQCPAGKSGSLVIPNGVTHIDSSAFYGCGKLTSVAVPNGVTNIGRSTFFGCGALTSVTLPASVASIDDDAFGYCSGLASLTIPGNVTYIGDEAFRYCLSLKTITIPALVEEIGYRAFTGCRALTAINVDPLNSSYASDSGVLFTVDHDYLIKCPEGKTGTYVIPADVTDIADSAFRYCTGLTKVSIPDGVTTIEESAFRYCSGLTGLTLPESVTQIGDFAFAGCHGLSMITIPEWVGYIGDYAFSGSFGLKRAYFAGDAPNMGEDVFFPASSGFTIYSLTGKTGFASPYWQGCPSVMLSSYSPEIVVTPQVGAELVDGAATLAFGSLVVSSQSTKTLTIRNAGHAPLTGLAVTSTGAGAPSYMVGALGANTLAPGASTSVTIAFKPASAGAKAADLAIASNDADENPFNIKLTGTGAQAEIAVSQGSDLTDGKSAINFNTVALNKTSVKTITIKNLGTAPLTGLAVTKNGSHAANYTCGALGATTLAPGASTTFKVTFKPTAKGARNAAIHIASNDANESPFDINLTGNGKAAPGPNRLSGAHPLASLPRSASGSAAHADSSSDLSPVTKGIDVIDGKKFRTLTIDKRAFGGNVVGTVRVSSNLTDWFSGANHTTVIQDNAVLLKVRDNTATSPNSKRHIRFEAD